MSKNQNLWSRAKQLIPGGNMLLSKRPDMFLPEQWPTYFSRARGCKVWDLEGRCYVDVSLMGVGTNILGYGHPDVDKAVGRTVEAGNMTTLNCPEEVHLAERLVELHPWADMVRLARTGGEANTIAIRIARAATGREKVAVCGYHGWHDWYLAANLSDTENLSEHLLPGLSPNGVPGNLRSTSLPFRYNHLEDLELLLAKHQDIGVIKMEVSRNEEPTNGFLEKVRDLATKHKIALIFDECTSGFRQTFGGLHKYYNVEPDMAVFGKALGNGYAITAIIGKREIMEYAQDSFISSTFWTERIGPVAAIKTLEVMEQIKSWATITAIGETIKQRWTHLADEKQLEIQLSGLSALAGYQFKGENALAYQTLVTQEMLKRGYLATGNVYVSIAHSPELLDRYFDELEDVFDLICQCEDGLDIMSLLNGPICRTGFERLN